MADIDNFNGVIIDDSVTPNRMRNLRVSDLVSGAGNSPTLLLNSAIPVGLTSSGTVGANGALSGIVSLGGLASGYVFAYFPAGAVYAGSVAGFYLVLLTSATTGTIYDNVYTTGSVISAIPTTPTPIVAAGPGAFVQTTSAVLGPNISVPANTIGSGSLRFSPIFAWSNSAGAKTFSPRAGAAAIFTISPTSGGSGQYIEYAPFQFRNRQPALNLAANNFPINTAFNNAPNYTALDTTVAQNFGVQVAVAAPATDWAFVVGLTLELIPGV